MLLCPHMPKCKMKLSYFKTFEISGVEITIETKNLQCAATRIRYFSRAWKKWWNFTAQTVLDLHTPLRRSILSNNSHWEFPRALEYICSMYCSTMPMYFLHSWNYRHGGKYGHGWDLSQPTFGRYINPILIRRDRLHPPHRDVPTKF